MSDEEKVQEQPQEEQKAAEVTHLEPQDLQKKKIEDIVIKPGKWRPGFLGSMRNLFQASWSGVDGELKELLVIRPIKGSIHAFRKRLNARAFLSVVQGEVLMVFVDGRPDKGVAVERMVAFGDPAANVIVPPGVYVGWKALSDDVIVIEGWLGESGEAKTMSWKALGPRVWEIQSWEVLK